MLAADQEPKTLNLRSGPNWSSFEKFRQQGATALDAVKDGTVASLQTKSGQYRILSERDYQTLYGLARDVDRLRGGLRMVISAIRAVQKHPDRETLEVLLESINLMNNLPELPTRDRFEPLVPEGLEIEPDDEFLLDPMELDRLTTSEPLPE
jgi:hypothetical protein